RRHISASSSEHSNLRALAVTHAVAFAKASTPVADLVRPASRAAAPACPVTLAADLKKTTLFTRSRFREGKKTIRGRESKGRVRLSNDCCG
ncbi:hypothetical protein HaLaN_30693, partial [Haematococcus lacustris]